MSYADIFKNLRKEKKLTQLDLANELKISKSCIAMIETGKNEPTANTLLSYANFFQCSADYLLGRTDDFGNVIIPDESMPTEEMKILAVYRQLPQDLKKRVSVYLDQLLAIHKTESSNL